MKSNKKLLTGIIIAVVCCVLAAVIVINVLLSGKAISHVGVEDTSVSYGYITKGSNPDMAFLTPYWCAFRFETNEYEENAVNGKISYAISNDIFGRCYRQLLGDCSHFKDKILEYNIYFLIQNTQVAQDLNNSLYHGEPEYAQQLKEFEIGTVQKGVYIHEKLEFNDFDSFPFDKYDISVYREEEQVFHEFAHTDEVTFPEQLFAGSQGSIRISLVECVTYDSGRVNYNTDDYGAFFYYLKEGSQVKISKTSFK